MSHFNLSLEEFKKQVAIVKEQYYQYGCGFELELGYSHPNLSVDDVLWYGRETHGVRGGSCWSTSRPTPYTCAEADDPGFEALDSLLEKVYPSLPFTRYRSLLTKVSKMDTRVSEYYGNYTCYTIEYIRVHDLYEFLQEPH